MLWKTLIYDGLSNVFLEFLLKCSITIEIFLLDVISINPRVCVVAVGPENRPGDLGLSKGHVKSFVGSISITFQQKMSPAQCKLKFLRRKIDIHCPM